MIRAVTNMNHTEKQHRIRFFAEAGIIAAAYAALTLLLAPVSYGPLQVRVAEAMCVLPAFTSAAVPGLFLGCLIANLYTAGQGMLDIVFGSLATLAAAAMTYKLRRKSPWLYPLPSVVINAFVVGWVLSVEYGIPFWMNVASVGAGQAVACYALGMPLYFLLQKYRRKIFLTLF